MAQHPTTGFDLEQTDRLLTTTKQVRKRLDLTRPVPYDELLECIDLANHAPMGGNLERNRWMIIDDADTKAKIAEYFAAVGRPYLSMNAEVRADDRSTKVIDVRDVPRRPPPRGAGARVVDAARPRAGRLVHRRLRGVLRLGAAGCVELPARRSFARDRFGLDHLPPRTRGCRRRVARHPTDRHAGLPARGRLLHRRLVHPAPRRPAADVTYLNRWKNPVG